MCPRRPASYGELAALMAVFDAAVKWHGVNGSADSDKMAGAADELYATAQAALDKDQT